MALDARSLPLPGAALGQSTHVRRLGMLLLALFGLAYALFTQDIVSHNTLCRAAMTANLVQSGRIDINGYEKLTRDLAARDGTYYCDKAPGMSFLATPAALAFTQLVPVTPEAPYGRTWLVFLYLCALTTSGLLCAAAAVLLFRYVLDRSQNVQAALVAGLAFGLGTPVWGWATSFFSHAATAALLVMGFIALDTANRKLATEERSAIGLALLGGLALGAATAVEYTALIPAAIIGAAMALTSAWSLPGRVLAMLAAAALGGLVALVPVMIFHAAAFGSPFTTGYAFTLIYNAHHSGLFGINAPRLDVIGKLLVSADRGVIWYAPVVLAAAWAAVLMVRRADLRAPAIVTILIAIYYLAMNAGFGYWHGGASTGPRYLTPAIGFSMLALGLAWPHFNTWQRRSALVLLGLSVLINFAGTAVGMTAVAPSETILPDFLSADLRQTLTYRLFKQASILHFVAPLLAGSVLGWLILREAKHAEAEVAGASSRGP